MIIAYQIDPAALDADKVATYEFNGEEHLLKFPHYLKPGMVMVPTEVTIQPRSYHAS